MNINNRINNSRNTFHVKYKRYVLEQHYVGWGKHKSYWLLMHTPDGRSRTVNDLKNQYKSHKAYTGRNMKKILREYVDKKIYPVKG